MHYKKFSQQMIRFYYTIIFFAVINVKTNLKIFIFVCKMPNANLTVGIDIVNMGYGVQVFISNC